MPQKIYEWAKRERIKGEVSQLRFAIGKLLRSNKTIIENYYIGNYLSVGIA